MNIRELNEHLERALKETSDETGERILKLRREQAARAKAKLDKTIQRMAKKGIGVPEEIKLTFKGYYCMTTEDNYEQGADSRSFGADWDSKKTEEVTLKLNPETISHDIMEIARDYTGLFWADDICGVWEDDDKITFCVEGNDDNERPSKEEWEEFKAGERNLWIIDANIYYEIDEEDKPFFIECCKKAKHIDMY